MEQAIYNLIRCGVVRAKDAYRIANLPKRQIAHQMASMSHDSEDSDLHVSTLRAHFAAAANGASSRIRVVNGGGSTLAKSDTVCDDMPLEIEI
jgi:hypothetical protein